MAMVRSAKLKQLFAEHVNDKTGVAGYRGRLAEMFGIEDGDDGPRINPSNQVINPLQIDAREIALEFLGRNPGADEIRYALNEGARHARLYEAEGGVVMPSHFANISAFSATVGGLVDALVMTAYQSPQWIGDSLFEVKEARVNGGKIIGIMNDGNTGDNLIDGEAYPTVGLKETYVTVPENKRRGQVIQVNEKTFLYDRTDLLESACTAAGQATARAKELDQAKTFMGVTNNYSRDGASSNTYLDANGANPNDFTNSSVNELTNYASVDSAYQVLEGNTDPGTGWEITVPAPQVAVMPQKEMNAKSILYPEFVRRLSDTGNTITQTAQSLVRPVSLVVLTRVWYNALVAAGVSTTNAPARWWLGDFKRTFKYRSIIPFQVNDAPLSSEDTRRDIVMVKVAREHGVPYVNEPRYTYMGTKEDITP